ncbi:MAG TPA: hypothetical protein VFO34_06730 [Candidatus Acidoferrales bacterium]|nr:hypothetical protein [Candidatus Acidoferrales bacterium]
MIDNTENWIKRADELIARGAAAGGVRAAEPIHFAVSMLTAFYGPQSPQLRAFLVEQEALGKMKPEAGNPIFAKACLAVSAIQNAKAELEGGLTTKVRILVSGEVLAELVRLSKEAFEEANTDEAKNVAAVLIAAAFEDVIRRMGEEFAGVTSRPKLEDVIAALKAADVLKGAQVTIALSYLKFRNDSLHADWKNIDRPGVKACISFVEELLAKHFS